MPPSMKRQLKIRKRSEERILRQSEDRKQAVGLLREGWKLSEVCRTTGVPKYTVSRLSHHLKSENEAAIENMTSGKAERSPAPVISDEEAMVINNRLILAAERRFDVDTDSFKFVLGRIASHGRKGWRGLQPSDDAVRSYRARFRDVSYKKVDNKENAKLAAECFRHVEPFFSALERVADENDGILDDPDRIFNLDETAIDCTLGRLQLVFTAAGHRNGGARVNKSSYGVSKHVTAVIAASVDGMLKPPFIIVAGRRKSSEWWAPINGSFKEKPHGIFARFVKDDWFPGDGVITVSENGPMEGPLLAAFVQHLNHSARKRVQSSTSILLCLDGHASQKGTEWLEQCVSSRIEAVVNAANTSHFYSHVIRT